MQRITASQVAPMRAKMLAQQDGKCLLCRRPIKSDPVLDHCHKDGYLRGVLHRGCNSMLGKLENSRKLYGLTDTVAFHQFLTSVISYLHNQRTDILHPTFKTEEQKRELRNKRARQRRAKEKLLAQ